MLEALLIFSGALLAGSMHALMGADHLAAIAPFAVEAGPRAWVVALRWGVGHALGIGVVGLIGYGLLDWIDLDWLAGLGEYLVGAVLIAIGSWALLHGVRRNFPDHSGIENTTHVHAGAAFLVGAVHGVAGTGNLLGVLPALAQSSWGLVATYLLGFGIGTILVMVGFAVAVGLAAGSRASWARRAFRGVYLGSAILCLSLGTLLIGLVACGVEIR